MTILTDPWLERWIPNLRSTVRLTPVLEIGCGRGADTVTLLNAGFNVVAFDLTAENVEVAKQAAPGAIVSVQNVLDPFPLEASGIDAIVASLSLHYFTWDQTLSVISRVHGTLRDRGLFLGRFNSTEDFNYGAVGNLEIEPGLFMVEGQAKRFFNGDQLSELFGSGWRVIAKEPMVSTKYGLPKALWEVVVERQSERI
jgi:SAM-dependent methyltransferase